MKTLNPEGWMPTRGYSNVLVADGPQVHIAGQIGWNPRTQTFEAEDFASQARQTLANVVEALRAAGTDPEHLVSLTWYVVDVKAYTAAAKTIGTAYRDLIGSHLPAMTMVQVEALLHETAEVEISAVAVLPTDD